MSTITYRREIRVYNEGLRVGTIKPVSGGYAYSPKGSKATGETFASIDDVKKSLERQ